MSSVEQLLQEADQLPKDQKLSLAHRLLASSEPSVSEEVKRAWDVEIRERMERYDRGESQSRPAGEVLSELDRRLNS